MIEWQPIADWECFYEVSRCGRVRRVCGASYRNNGTMQTWSGRDLNLSLTTKGYCVVRLSAPGKRKMARVHRLVADAFVDNPRALPEVNHIDGNKQNNRASNLEWCTTRENAVHAVKNRLSKITKLSDEEVQMARTRWRNGASTRSLARHFKIDPSSMRQVLRGNTYRWVPPPPPREGEAP